MVGALRLIAVGRALAGFGIGLAICVMYWSFGFIPREAWLSSPVANSMVQAKGWIWPTAFLDVVFRDVGSEAAVAILYVLNGLTYAAISAGSFVLRARPVLYVSFMMTVLGLLTLVQHIGTAGVFMARCFHRLRRADPASDVGSSLPIRSKAPRKMNK